jgi:type IV secretory pathway TraG/TraD family ATPase VirD4
MGDGSTDRDHWSSQARRALAGLLYTAAVGGYDMSQIGWWVAHQDDEVRDGGETVRPVAAQIEALLEDHDPLMADQVSAFLRTNERTRTSITNSMAPALAWLSNPAARQAATGERPFDVEALLRDRATIYLLGAESGATAALVAALTGHIAREARRLSAAMPGERLDPPLRIVLDEANLICPVPLARWTADMGGRGITIMAAFQSRAQLMSKWGPSSAAEIINNAGGIIVYGGTADRDDLQYWSAIIGDRDEVIAQTGPDGEVTGYSTRSVPVISPARLRALPRARAVVLRRHLDPVVGVPGVLWRQRRLPVPGWLVRWHRSLTRIPGAPVEMATPEPEPQPGLALVDARSGEAA